MFLGCFVVAALKQGSEGQPYPIETSKANFFCLDPD
jgi:hypothetical protein